MDSEETTPSGSQIAVELNWSEPVGSALALLEDGALIEDDDDFAEYEAYMSVQNLEELIALRLESGPMAVAEYMRLIVAHPVLGYYATRDPFGKAGDFVTAPEVSQMFGELLGLWCAHVWGLMGSPKKVQLVELGPGRGTLMADALRACGQAAPSFLQAVNVHLIEVSPVLREKQKNAMSGHPVQWHDSLNTVPEGPMILLANEFFDAMPVHQLVKTQNGWCERQVYRAKDGGLKFTVDQRPSPLVSFLHPQVAVSGLGSIAEISPKSCAVARAIRKRLDQFGGVALVIDYGHETSATGETLQAIRHHQPHDILTHPGSADVTAHVDFGAVGRNISNRSVQVSGPVTQGFFLQRLGIIERAATLAKAQQPERQREIARQVERLTAVREMGELFKVMVAASKNLPVLPGFVP
ncbi:MAG: SAM-dependent methyltransferase [Candidatus Pacebacteria bacterium]|nr:SAM-dependent methyltransferase [Candidatus Paceibacterota bacterium]